MKMFRSKLCAGMLAAVMTAAVCPFPAVTTAALSPLPAAIAENTAESYTLYNTEVLPVCVVQAGETVDVRFNNRHAVDLRSIGGLSGNGQVTYMEFSIPAEAEDENGESWTTIKVTGYNPGWGSIYCEYIMEDWTEYRFRIPVKVVDADGQISTEQKKADGRRDAEFDMTAGEPFEFTIPKYADMDPTFSFYPSEAGTAEYLGEVTLQNGGRAERIRVTVDEPGKCYLYNSYYDADGNRVDYSTAAFHVYKQAPARPYWGREPDNTILYAPAVSVKLGEKTEFALPTAGMPVYTYYNPDYTIFRIWDRSTDDENELATMAIEPRTEGTGMFYYMFRADNGEGRMVYVPVVVSADGTATLHRPAAGETREGGRRNTRVGESVDVPVPVMAAKLESVTLDDPTLGTLEDTGAQTEDVVGVTCAQFRFTGAAVGRTTASFRFTDEKGAAFICTYELIVHPAADAVPVTPPATTVTTVTTTTTTTVTTGTMDVGLSMKQPPAKLTYAVGEAFSIAGARFDGYANCDTVNADWFDAAAEDMPLHIDTSHFDSTKPGTYTVCVTLSVSGYDNDGNEICGESAPVAIQVTVTGEPGTETGTTTTATGTTTTTTYTTDPAAPEGQRYPVCWGDANCDGTVDVKDAVLIARVAAEDHTLTLPDNGTDRADITRDGRINEQDLMRLLRALAGKITRDDLWEDFLK